MEQGFEAEFYSTLNEFLDVLDKHVECLEEQNKQLKEIVNALEKQEKKINEGN